MQWFAPSPRARPSPRRRLARLFSLSSNCKLDLTKGRERRTRVRCSLSPVPCPLFFVPCVFAFLPSALVGRCLLRTRFRAPDPDENCQLRLQITVLDVLLRPQVVVRR